MDWIEEVLKKYDSLIFRLGVNAPFRDEARVHFYDGVKVALAEYVDEREIEVIVEEAEKKFLDLHYS